MTPSARPRISSLEAITTIVDCIVPKPAVPNPSRISSGSDTANHCDVENASAMHKPTAEPIT